MRAREQSAFWAFLMAGCIAAGLVLGRWAPALASVVPRCPLIALTGVPCPTCGLTRAALALARGDAGAALALQPLGVVVVVGVALWTLWAAAHLVSPRFVPAPRVPADRRTWAARLVVIAAIANWGYLLAELPRP